MVNQDPEQEARDKIDEMLEASGWEVQSMRKGAPNKINLNVGEGQAVREYQTDVGPADYVLFIDKKAVGVIEAKTGRRRSKTHCTRSSNRRLC
jgi:type I restriction enzyme R subunit